MDLKCIRIDGKQYVNLEEDIHIATTVRMKTDCLIKPQTAFFCYGVMMKTDCLIKPQTAVVCYGVMMKTDCLIKPQKG